MATLGEAFIEVHADTRPFAKELKKQVDTLLKKVDSTIGPQGAKIGSTLGEKLRKGFEKETDGIALTLGARLRNVFRQIGADSADEFQKSFRRLATSNFIVFRVIGNLAERMGALFKTVGRVGGQVLNFSKTLLQANGAMIQLGFEGIKSLLGFTNDFSRSLASAQQAGTNLAGAVASLAASAASGAVGLIAMAAAATLLVTVMAALIAILIVAAAPFAQLLNFALLIPAALSVLLAIIAPLVIALHDLGDSLKLVFEQDPKKFAEGFAKLSPVMKQLTTLLRGFVPLFKSIQRVVQENFLGPIIMTLGPLLRTIGPSLRNGLGEAAAAMGIFVADVLRLLQEPAFRRFIDELFPAVARIIETMSPALLHLLSALATASLAALPTVERLVGKLASFIESFATWIETTVADGRFQTFLDDAVESAQAIWNLIKSLILLFAEMFTQTDEGGRSFLEKITAAVNEFTKWLKSPEGKRALEDAVVLAITFAQAFKVALGIIRIIVAQLSNAIRATQTLLSLIGVLDGKQATIRARNNAPPGNSYSGGGVVGYDQIAMVHKGEPILDPANSADKNRGILQEAGMLDLLSQPNVTNVYLGNEKLAEYIDYRVSTATRSNAKSIAYGARSS